MLRDEVEQNGFAIVPDVLNQDEISPMLRKLDEAPFRRSRAGIRHLMSNPDVATLARDPRLLGIASEILGSEAFPFRATLFDKSSDANWLVVWHQDTALPLRGRKETNGWGPWSVKEGITYAHAPTHALDQVIALRVHLDDSREQNGPLRVLPGTHKLSLLTDDEVFRLSTERLAVDCLAAQGAVLAMRPLLIHSSSKSQNALPRRVLHIEYASSISTGDGLDLAVA
jgi:ectoine hydroxylase-related dioxygenase (phytanoyl-CoA dioxygenase family)